MEADRDRFSFGGGVASVAAASAELAFEPPPPDYENPTDAASAAPDNPAGNNEYVVELTATSGADAMTTQIIVVTVTDVGPPPKPDAPTAAPADPDGSNKLTVGWNAPDTTGMEPISDYNVRYRAEGAADWTDAFYDGTDTATTIGGLADGITYEVQVQAVNREGQSDWSNSGAGTTASRRPPPPAAGPPHITNPGSKTYIQGQLIPEFAITVDDDGDTLTVSVDGLPADLTYNAGTGLVSGTVSPTAEARAYIVTIGADDGVTPQVTATFNITVWPAEPVVSVGFRETAVEVSEGGSTVLAVELSGRYPLPVTVIVTAFSGTADEYDYAPFTAADLTINPGETSGTVSVAIADDGLPEDEEEFGLRLALADALPGLVLNTAAETVRVVIPANGLTVIEVGPRFDTASAFSVPEKTTAVGTVTASDPDSGDTITSIEITGGVDRDRFSFSGGTTSVAADSARLVFRMLPDHEDPADKASSAPANPAGNNEYVVELTATGGADAMTSVQTITVTVTDVDEPPPKPAAPTVAPAAPNELTVDWNTPDTTGAEPINDYNARYRESGAADWTDAFYDGTDTAVTIGGLTAGTVYEVQVQAGNREGQSGWSDSGTGTPVNEPPVITNPGDRTVRPGAAVSFPIRVDDDGGAPAVSVDGLPDGLSYNAGTGMVSGTAPLQTGPHDVTIPRQRRREPRSRRDLQHHGAARRDRTARRRRNARRVGGLPK